MATTALDEQTFDGFVSGNGFVVVGFLGGTAEEQAAFAVATAAAQAAHPEVAFAAVDAGHKDLFSMFGVEGSAIAIFRERVVLYFEPGIPAAGKLGDVLSRAAALDMSAVHAELEQQRLTESALATHRVCPTARRGKFP